MRRLLIGALATSCVASVAFLNLVAWPRYESERLGLPTRASQVDRLSASVATREPALGPRSSSPADVDGSASVISGAESRLDGGEASSEGDATPGERSRGIEQLASVDAGVSPSEAPPPEAPEEAVANASRELPPPFSDIQFRSGAVLLGPRARSRADELALLMRSRPSLQVTLRGHTDVAGDPYRNVSISRARAEAVARRLVEQGIEDSRIHTEGLGGTEPLDRHRNELAMRRNRRVQVVWR